MPAYDNALVLDDTASEQSLLCAAQALDRCEQIVVLKGVVALRPTPIAIICEVADPLPNSHRCAEEFKVMVENAARGLAASKLGRLLPARPLQWRVVTDIGADTVELWPVA